MGNPYQPPNASMSDPQPSVMPSRLWRSVIVASAVWCCFIGLAAMFGGILSLFTGKADELPTWNGWSYLAFSVKEGTMFGVILTWPFALIAFVLSYIASRSKGGGWTESKRQSTTRTARHRSQDTT